jgi:hypothetical protein
MGESSAVRNAHETNRSLHNVDIMTVRTAIIQEEAMGERDSKRLAPW